MIGLYIHSVNVHDTLGNIARFRGSNRPGSTPSTRPRCRGIIADTVFGVTDIHGEDWLH